MTELTDLSDTDALNTEVTSQSTEGNVANMGNMDNLFQATLGMLSRFRNSNIFRLRDNTDKTKLLALDLSGLPSGTSTLALSGSGGAAILDRNPIVLKQSSSPTPTAEGDIQWDTDDNSIIVGDGSGAQTFRPHPWETLYNGSFSGASDFPIVSNFGACRFIRITGSILVSTATGLGVRYTVNSGSSWISGASDYTRNELHWLNGTATAGIGNDSRIFLNAGENIDTSFACSFTIDIDNVTGTRVGLTSQATFRGSTTGNLIRADVQGELSSIGGPVGGIQFVPLGGTISGRLLVMGLRA